MTDQYDGYDFSEQEIAEEMREVANEFTSWIQGGGFETGLKREARERLKAKAEGRYIAAKDKAEFERAFKPDTRPGRVSEINSRLNELYAKGHMTRAEEAERAKLTRELQESMNRYPNASSKKARE